MNKLYALLLGVFVAFPAMADPDPPSDASLRELLTITESRSLVDGAMEQVDASMQASMKQAFADRPLSEAEQKIMDDMRARLVQIFREEMAWETLEPMFIDLYSRTFSQAEVDGMLGFYRSPAGQAVIAKMPLVMQNSMQAMQGRMAVMMPRIQQLQRDTAAQLQATESR
jgi:uncharacterized protein